MCFCRESVHGRAFCWHHVIATAEQYFGFWGPSIIMKPFINSPISIEFLFNLLLYLNSFILSIFWFVQTMYNNKTIHRRTDLHKISHQTLFFPFFTYLILYVLCQVLLEIGIILLKSLFQARQQWPMMTFWLRNKCELPQAPINKETKIKTWNHFHGDTGGLPPHKDDITVARAAAYKVMW